MTDEPTPPDDLAPAALDAATADAPSRGRMILKIALRVLLVVGLLGFSAFALAKIFDDLDWAETWESLRSLGDADLVSLAAVWMIWIASQGMLTGALIAELPVRRGILAFLGPNSVTAIVPGPSDLPVRHKMFRSWGIDPAASALSVAAGGIFTIGIKLVLPVMAAAVLVVSETPIEGTIRLVVIIATLVAVGLVAAAMFLASETWSRRLSRLVERVFGATLRLLRRPEPADLAARLLTAREGAVRTLRARWLIATWATLLTAALKYALLLLCLRITGVPDSALSWSEVFVAFGITMGLTVFPLTPGDAGVSEIALIGMIGGFAGPEWINQVTAGVFLYRIATWLFMMPVGWVALLVWRRGVSRSAPTQSVEPASSSGA
jgi:putative heme transporter